MLENCHRTRRRPALAAVGLVLFPFLPFLAACGGGGGGTGGGKGGLILLSFDQNGQDNVPLNRVLTFLFSGPVDPASVYVTDAQGKQRSTGAIQIREGDAFGLTVTGTYAVNGAEVQFRPQLPGLCDLSDAGLHPDTQYRVTVVGYPEALAVRAVSGVLLDRTMTAEFHTRPDDDPQVLEDQIPAQVPTVLSTVPASGTAGVAVHGDDPATTAYEGNEVRVLLSENIGPCSIRLGQTVLVNEYQRGDLNSGFVPPDDQTPNDPYTWSTTLPALPQPQRIRATVSLENDFEQTELVIRPEFTRWPDNALIVVELTFDILDFGGQPLTPVAISFTTENLPAQSGVHRLSMDGETEFLTEVSTADVNTARAVSRVQGYLLFAGDGDNGSNQLQPTLPETPASACLLPRQGNDGLKDNFDPLNSVTLDTGATKNTCPNATDGSTAVVWEFNTFRIRPGVTVRIIGVNPAILLVLGNVTIETGGTLMVRGDGVSPSPQGRGGNGVGSTNNPTAPAGGIGVAGGEAGGDAVGLNGGDYGKDGTAGFGSPNYGQVGGHGAGLGGVATKYPTTNTGFAAGGMSAGGGGGGHAVAGNAGMTAAPGGGNTGAQFAAATRSGGGGAYPTVGANDLSIDEMGFPSAGSGGGAAGNTLFYYSNYNYTFYSPTGGAGGAGGGFVDLTSSGTILVQGTIDLAGSRGGSGANSYYTGSAGGGGGSGGGLRLLTPSNINVTGAVITAAGGAAGAGAYATGAAGTANNGGAGGWGRIVMEDGDSVITGLAAATVIPGEGSAGFLRQQFNAARFQGGGLAPEALTDLVFMGPTSPTYLAPVQADFAEPPVGEPGSGFPGAAIPNTGSRGLGKVGIVIEASGYPIQSDGTASDTPFNDPQPWFTIGWFTDSGVPDAPDWTAATDANPWPTGDVGAPPSDNAASAAAGGGIAHLDGASFLKFRFKFFLPQGIGPFDEGPYVNDWAVRFTFDQ